MRLVRHSLITNHRPPGFARARLRSPPRIITFRPEFAPQYKLLPNNLALTKLYTAAIPKLLECFVVASSRVYCRNNPLEKGNQSQERIVNLGAMIDELKTSVPTLLSQTLSQDLLSGDVLLRMCPTLFDEFNVFLPNIKGHISYYATIRTLQWLLNSFVLNPRVMIHIQSIRTSTGADPQAVYAHSTKIFVRWKTCSAGCHHLSIPDPILDRAGSAGLTGKSFYSTADATLGSHRWSHCANDARRNSDDLSVPFPAIPKTFLHLSDALAGLRRDSRNIERVISGVFIFELNEPHTKIIAHTIENVELSERGDPESISDGLRVC